MSRSRHYHASKGVDNVDDWSYSRFVFGIAAFILFGVTCFFVGYVLAKFDPPLKDDLELASRENVEVTVEPQKAVQDQTPPQKSEAKPESPRESTAPPPLPPGGVVRSDAIPPKVTPIPDPGTGPTTMVKTAVTLPTTGSPAPAAPAPATAPATAPTPATAPVLTPSEPVEPAAELESVVAPTPPPAVKPSAPVVTPPTVTPPKLPKVANGSFCIQLGFFDGADRKQRADAVKKSLKSGANLDAAVHISADGKEYRVVIEGFSTREDAKAACEKLKTKTGFADAWVTRLP